MADTEAKTQEFLVVDVGTQRFAFNTAAVASVLAPPDITPLPFVANYVEGLVNVNDRVLALLNLSQLFAMPARQDQSRSELLVLETGRVPCAVRVDRIIAKVDVNADAVDAITSDADNDATDKLAHARFDYLDDTVLVLNPALLGDLVTSRELAEGEPGMLGRHEPLQTDTQQLNTCLSFSVSGEHYAFALQQVVEILDHQISTPLPGAGAEVEGLARVRSDVLLVISLAGLLGLPSSQRTHQQILVLELDGRRYGLRVDSVHGTLSFNTEDVRGIEDEDSEVIGVLVQDQNLIGLLAPQRLINAERQRRWSGLMPRRRATTKQIHEATREILEVRMGDELYGVPLTLVRTISALTEFDHINPDQSGLISGAAHIKGKVLPVVDFGRLLSCANHNTEANGRGAWVVVGEGDEEWAVPVAEARLIRRIPESAIEAVEDARGRYVAAIANFNQKLLPLISIRPLMPSG